MQQHPTYGQACTALGGQARMFALSAKATVRRALASALVLERRWPGLGPTAMLARGPVWHPDLSIPARSAALQRLVTQLERSYRVVIATPDPLMSSDTRDPLQGTGRLALYTGGVVAHLPLTPDPQGMRNALHGKWRNRLVQAERRGLDIRMGPLPLDPDHWLLTAEAAQARARRYRRLPPAFALAWRKAGGARSCLLAEAWQDGAPVAGMLFLQHGNGASYHTGWAGDAGRAADAHRVLLFQAALCLAAKGCTRIDLGALDTVNTPGLARFKLGAGADCVHLGATRITAPGTRWVARLFDKTAKARPESPSSNHIVG